MKATYKARADVDDFLKLPRRAQELFFEIMEESEMCDANPYTPFYILDFCNDETESPIEQIFLMAFNYESFRVAMEKELDTRSICLTAQARIITDDGVYRADFLFDPDDNEEFAEGSDFRLVIECDGHAFHEKTKEQVAKDNDRDMALKKAGYDVIHFSGSQIFRRPQECARKAAEYIFTKVLGK